MQSAAPAAELHLIWVHQLMREYEAICWHHDIKLLTPMLRVERLESRWASYTQLHGLGLITVNVELIEKYPWHVVVEILKHEMAHHLVAQQQLAPQTAHGPAFAAACVRLAVAPWARAAAGALPTEPLQTWREMAVGAEEMRLTKKVEKLLALANSANEHEALSAMRRVQEIYSRYNLRRGLCCAGDDEMVTLVLGGRRRRLSRVEGAVVGLLVAHFGVRSVYANQYNAQDDCTYRVTELLGPRHCVVMAEYVHTFLHAQLQALWAHQHAAGHRGVTAKVSYQLGVIAGFDAKLRTSKLAADAVADAAHLTDAVASNPAALRQRADAALRKYEQHRHPRLRSASWGARRHDPRAYGEGIDAGRRLTLHRPLGGTAPAARGHLLGC